MQKNSLILLALATPLHTYAIDVDIEATFMWLYRIVDMLTQIVIFVAILLLFWALVRMLTAGGDEEQKEAAMHNLRNALLVIAVAVALWFVLTLFVKYFNFDSLSPVAEILFDTITI
jgi:NADH:ubiquinone oxidoreductase subunit 6 (subunit J)